MNKKHNFLKKIFILFLLLLCSNIKTFSKVIKKTNKTEYKKRNTKISKNNSINKTGTTNKKHLYIKVDTSTDRSFYFLSKDDEKILKKIQQTIKKGNFFDAYVLSEDIKTNGFKEAINIYITSQKYLSYKDFTKEHIKDIMDFNSEYKFLSTFKKFNSIIEDNYLADIVHYDDVKTYFNTFKSENINVVIKFFQDQLNQQKSNIDTKKINKIYTDINNFWITNNLNYEENNLFYQTFAHIIVDEATIEKLELKVFERSSVNDYLKYLKSQKYRNMFEIIVELKKNNPKNLKFINKEVDKELQNNEALIYSKLLYYRKNKDDSAIVDLLLKLKESGKYAKYWWNYRNIITRNLIGKKEYKKAYTIITGYAGAKSGENYLDSEWMAGWIACDFLKDYNLALKHFFNFRSKVFYPQSMTKGDYWIARCYELLGNNSKALQYYNKGSKYPMAFYAQISHYSKYNLLFKDDPDSEYKEMVFPTLPEVSNDDIDKIDNDKIVKLFILYYKYLYEREEATELIKYIINRHLKQKGEITEFVRIVEYLEDEPLIVLSAKQASYKLVFFLDHLFPEMRLVNKKDPSMAIIHSIIKQESGFTLQAISNVGAIGFMQIMPATARALCKQLKITYNEYKLKHDAQYNIKLGKYYIESLIKSYKGSKVLAVAAYNAGPSAVKKWINTYGDLREKNSVAESITWIESIDYKETRNYVQRVLENLLVYEYLLAN